MAVGQVGFKDPRKVCYKITEKLIQPFSGEEGPCCTKREPDCQSSQQDQSREVPGSCDGEGGEAEDFEEERPGCTTGAGKILFLRELIFRKY